MTLILSNDDVAEILTVEDCLDRLRESYVELGALRAISRPRSDIFGPSADGGRYVFKTMDGMLPVREVAALRLNSDVIHWRVGPGGVRKEKIPVAGDGKWVGLVLIFSTRTGEPLAVMPDGVIQRLRVGGTNAIAAELLAAPDASTYALLGAGWQAVGQARAIAAVRPIREIRVYSPTPANRERVAAELVATLGIDVRAVASAQEAASGADIIGSATNSITPVVDADWIEPHAHVTCVKELELDPRVLRRAALVVVHTRADRPANFIVGQGNEPIYAHDPKEGVNDDAKAVRGGLSGSSIDLTKQPDLAELVTGQVPLPPAGSLTCFVNTIGTGLQFAALGALAVERARERGVGREIPTDWFLESVHP